MSDLVELVARLSATNRALVERVDENVAAAAAMFGWGWLNALLDAARAEGRTEGADRIERLEAALNRIAAWDDALAALVAHNALKDDAL